MKTKLPSVVAVALLSVSSLAFAADNKGGDKGAKSDGDRTGSVQNQNGNDQPSRKTIDQCKTAPADDPNCRNLNNQ